MRHCILIVIMIRMSMIVIMMLLLLVLGEEIRIEAGIGTGWKIVAQLGDHQRHLTRLQMQ